MKVQSLRKKYPTFIYRGYSYELSRKTLKVSFNFEIQPRDKKEIPITFHPRLKIKGVQASRLKEIGKEALDNLVFNLGLIELLSYWKATCSPSIIIKAGPLQKTQINWWRKLIIKGMGEFFYQNKIDWKNPSFLSISSENKEGKNPIAFQEKLKKRVLVPIGGGKDSLVSLETIKRLKVPFCCFSLNPTSNVKQLVKIGKCKSFLKAKRRIDPKLLQMNQQGFLNGHTPFSAYLAFLTSLLAVIFNYRYVALSNERSSNEGSLKYLGKEINHQYSKSFDFERRFRKYSKRYLSKSLNYFSLLRPLYEIQVTKIFSQYPDYFPAFLSCNEAFKTDSGLREPTGKWCNACPKCLFVFAALYPFIEGREVVKIFGQNLFEKRELIPIMEKLVGKRKNKPLECIGTRKESLLAFYLSWKKADRVGKVPVLLKHFQRNILPRQRKRGALKYPELEKESRRIMASWNKKHYLPEKFIKHLKKSLVLDKF